MTEWSLSPEEIPKLHATWSARTQAKKKKNSQLVHLFGRFFWLEGIENRVLGRQNGWKLRVGIPERMKPW